MKPPRLSIQLVVTFALCLAFGIALAGNKNLKFGSGGERSFLMLDTNLLGTFGGSTTNEAGGGTATSVSNVAFRSVVWTDTTATAIPTSNGTVATISQVTIPNNALENNGDSIRYTASGTMPTGVANTNEFAFVYGSTTVMTSGMWPSNTSYFAELMLTRTAAAQLLARASLWWGPPGAALPHHPLFTNTTVFIAETNIVDTVLSFRGSSRRQGSSTNLFNQLEFLPTGK